MSANLPWWHDPPTDPTAILLKLTARFAVLRHKTEEGEALRRLLIQLNRTFHAALREAKDACPIAFFKPSYEQALMLNAWVYGCNFPITFASNRIGKTACYVINALLWLLPNDPGWIMFQEYTDHLGRKVRVLPRPRLAALTHIQDFFRDFPGLAGNPNASVYDPENAQRIETSHREAPGLWKLAYPAAPIQENCSVWLGAPDKEWHRAIMMRRWKDWIPKYAIDQWNTTECYFRLNTASSTNPKPITVDVSCKSYESKDEKWSGDAVTGIMLSEGFGAEILTEVKMRLAPVAFASWDYTPVEARNVGKKTQLAHKVFKGQEEMPLRTHVFTKFRVADAPEHIIPRTKREDMIRMYAGTDIGKARIEGEFFSSSRQILQNLNKEFHCLPWTKEYLFERFPTGLRFRSMDPGFDHPTAVCWALLAPNNCWYVYRFFAQRGLTIPVRCQRIIELSGNARQRVSYGPGVADFMWQECHPHPHSEGFVGTIADYKMFVTDQSSGLNQSVNYAKEGLPLVESVHLSPEVRATQLDSKLDLRAYPYSAHPIRGIPPGAGVYFLTGEPGVAEAVEKMESLFWDMLMGGPNKGESKDKVPIHGDDELDALCYLTSSNYIWHPAIKERKQQPQDVEAEVDALYTRRLYAPGYGPDDVTSQQSELTQPYGRGRPGYF